MDLPPMDVPGRLTRVRSAFDSFGCDALLVTNLVNVRYLTGFTGSAALLLVRQDDALLLTDGRYRTQSAEQLSAAGVEVGIEIGNVPQQREALRKAAGDIGRLGLEAASITWAQQRDLAGELEPELTATVGLVEGLRRSKDDGEVARIEAAAAIADASLAACLPLLLDGPSEAEFALALESEMRRRGASGPSFETIVAGGPNGAKPHARPTSRRIERGELVVLDFGATVDGYRSDMTRTVCVGEPDTSEMRRMVEVVAASQAAGVAAVRAGEKGANVDRVCRETIAELEPEWASAFVHGTGHGVGLDIHEAPAVSSTSTDTLDARHVVTVEPGIYLPELGGVRIEDTVLVTDDGCRPLTHAPKDLVIS